MQALHTAHAIAHVLHLQLPNKFAFLANLLSRGTQSLYCGWVLHEVLADLHHFPILKAIELAAMVAVLLVNKHPHATHDHS